MPHVEAGDNFLEEQRDNVRCFASQAWQRRIVCEIKAQIVGDTGLRRAGFCRDSNIRGKEIDISSFSWLLTDWENVPSAISLIPCHDVTQDWVAYNYA